MNRRAFFSLLASVAVAPKALAVPDGVALHSIAHPGTVPMSEAAAIAFVPKQYIHMNYALSFKVVHESVLAEALERSMGLTQERCVRDVFANGFDKEASQASGSAQFEPALLECEDDDDDDD